MLSYRVKAGTPGPVACDGSGRAGRIEVELGLTGGGGQGRPVGFSSGREVLEGGGSYDLWDFENFRNIEKDIKWIIYIKNVKDNVAFQCNGECFRCCIWGNVPKLDATTWRPPLPATPAPKRDAGFGAIRNVPHLSGILLLCGAGGGQGQGPLLLWRGEREASIMLSLKHQLKTLIQTFASENIYVCKQKNKKKFPSHLNMMYSWYFNF